MTSRRRNQDPDAQESADRGEADGTAESVRNLKPASSVYSTTFRVISDKLLADDRLTPADKLVILALQKWGFGSDHCYPSIQTLASACCLSESQARNSLKKLAKLGLIRIETDPTNRTTRRIVRLWMADPELHPIKVAAPSTDPGLGCRKNTQGPLGVESAADLGCRKYTPALGVESTPERTLLREPLEGTTKTSESSLTSLPQENGPERAGGDGGWRDYQRTTAIDLAVKLWPDELSDTMRSKAERLCEDFGPRNDLAALRLVETSGKSRTWAYLVGIAKNSAKGDGPLAAPSKAKETSSSSPRSEPIRTRATVAEGKAERVAKWLKDEDTPADIRQAFEAAAPDVRKVVEAMVDQARSPAVKHPAIRVRLGLESSLSPPLAAPPVVALAVEDDDLLSDPFSPDNLLWLDAHVSVG
jgi:Helix-turn-helix domain